MKEKPTSLEVLFAPAEFAMLPARDLSQTVCVVFDVLRATSTMVTALANGAAAIMPVEDIPEALGIRSRQPDVLLAGERDGVRIDAALTGSIPFDLGNSPREFTPNAVAGRTIVTTTTNGTRALRACARAKTTLASAFLNLTATADWITREAPPNLLLVCSGTHDQAALEDILAAGALCDRVWDQYHHGKIADSARVAREPYFLHHRDLPTALASSRNGHRLMALPDLREDVAFCARTGVIHLVAQMGMDGRVTTASR